jgi:two-component system sensor histidine kinase VicK
MHPGNFKHIRFKALYLSCKFLLSLLVAIAFVSCRKKEAANANEYSVSFKKINDYLVYYRFKKPGDDIHYLDSAYRQISNPTINDRFRYYAIHFMYNHKETHNKRNELLYADSMLAMAEITPGTKQYVSNFAEANFAKGDAYFDSKQYNEAYKCFYEGYYLGKNHLDNAVLAEYTYRMGMIMFRQSHFQPAANYFKESYRQSLSYNDDFRAFYQRQELLDDVGESFESNGNIDSAELYYDKALAYINKNSIRYQDRATMLDVARAVVYGNQGKIAFTYGQYQAASNLLKKSIDINLKPFNDNYNAELVEITLGQLYLDNHNYDNFLSLMQEIHRQLATVKNMEAETAWNKLMVNYYTQKKDFAQAFAYFNNYSTLKDSLNKQSNSIRETDVKQQWANYDKQYQIEGLRGNNKLQLIYLYIAIICVTMAVIIIFLVYSNGKRSKNDVLAVSELNRRINQQRINLETTFEDLKVNGREKDRILHTVAHDLRNPIGGIVALTNAMIEDDYTSEQKVLIGLVNDVSQNSLELINEILEATNNINGGINKELVEINSLVNNSVEILGFKAAEKEQQIVAELGKTAKVTDKPRKDLARNQ